MAFNYGLPGYDNKGWQLSNEFGCSAFVPEQKIAAGTAQSKASEGLTSICSMFRLIVQF